MFKSGGKKQSFCLIDGEYFVKCGFFKQMNCYDDNFVASPIMLVLLV